MPTEFSWLDAEVIWWIFGVSTVLSILGVLAIPWLLIRIPADFFADHHRLGEVFFSDRPLLQLLARIVANLLGIGLILLGMALLVLPGQGILTILLGLALTSVPGKHRATLWLLSKPWVRGPINRLRRRNGRQPLTFAHDTDL